MAKHLFSSPGIKNTKQRDLILQTFLKTKEHVDIPTLCEKVRKLDPKIGVATVYRTIKLLKNSGRAHERHFGTKHAVYEPHHENTHHDHLICLECKKIVEFENHAIERLQENVAKKYGYTLTNHKHELYGYCKDCGKK